MNTSVKNEDFVGACSSGATTDDGNTASASLLAFQVSPGKAYIKGYEIPPFQYLGVYALKRDINDDDNFYVLICPISETNRYERLYVFINDESFIPMIKDRLEIVRELEYGDWPPHLGYSDDDY